MTTRENIYVGTKFDRERYINQTKILAWKNVEKITID